MNNVIEKNQKEYKEMQSLDVSLFSDILEVPSVSSESEDSNVLSVEAKYASSFKFPISISSDQKECDISQSYTSSWNVPQRKDKH